MIRRPILLAFLTALSLGVAYGVWGALTARF
jgi:hypothetical protein